ncbi:hypothetical protein C8F04DRAFT_572463 [Mycena alexandri]|uniref:Uncharacterized protein n=1 Tax=Mycena alexandri TaxID=1745969 RepID=A0AAD6SUM6_9AGAR|nr:hypothetical protein C8F04DRAFT_572463 [Mycena alexandri]
MRARLSLCDGYLISISLCLVRVSWCLAGVSVVSFASSMTSMLLQIPEIKHLLGAGLGGGSAYRGIVTNSDRLHFILLSTPTQMFRLASSTSLPEMRERSPPGPIGATCVQAINLKRVSCV